VTDLDPERLASATMTAADVSTAALSADELDRLRSGLDPAWRAADGRLVREFRFPTFAAAFGLATRVHRSGGFAKDAIYLDGFRAIVDYVTSGGPLAPFWLGKIARTDVPAIEELLQRGLVHAPTFLPSYLDRPDVQGRIARLTSKIGLNTLLEMEPA